MADRELRLRVGAAIDASFGQVMSSVVEAAKRARRQVAAEMTAGAKEGSKAHRAAAVETKAAIETTTAAQVSAKQKADAMAADVLRKAKANAREKVSIERAAMAEVERDLRQHNQRKAAAAREAAREEANAARTRVGPKDLSRGGALMARAGGVALSKGAQMVSSVMHGMGLETSLQGQLHESQKRQMLAIEASSQGYIGSGKGPEGSNKYTDPNEVLEHARKVGTETGNDTNEVLEGINKFVRMTGDLKTARDSMGEIGKIAKANAVDMGDMMEAAANVSISMGEVPDKGKHLAVLMRTVAGQGHLGAVAIKDMASQMGKLTAQSNFFKIDPMSAKTLSNAGVTDDVGQRIAVMGAMAQWARAKGGRITAQQATQSSMAFMRDLANPTEIKRMKEQGIQVYADEGHTKVRDPLQMFLEVAKKAQAKGGLNRDVINRVFTNQQSRAVANAMAQDYNAAYTASKKGTEAEKHQEAMESLTETFQNYLRVTETNAEVSLKFGAAMGSAESQAKIFNNQMGKASDQLMQALLPAVQALAPVMLQLATAGADWLSKILGVEGATTKNSFAVVRSGGDAANEAAALAEKAGKLTTGRKVFDFKTGGMVDEIGPAVTLGSDKKAMFLSEKSKMEATMKALEEEISKEGDKGSGVLGKGKQYKNMSDKELMSEANSTLGDGTASRIIQDKANLDQLKEAMNRLTDSMNKLDVLKGAGRVQEVAVVADHTAPAGGGAKPATSGVQPVDASHH